VTAVGDAIMLEADGLYTKASSTEPDLMVCGTVTELQNTTNGPDKFYYRPVGPVVRVPMPAAPPGSLIYVGSTPGSLVASEPFDQAVPVYIRLDDQRGILLSRATPLPAKLDMTVLANGVVRGHRFVLRDGTEADPTNPAHCGKVFGLSLHAANDGTSLRVRIAGEVQDPSFSFDPAGALYVGESGSIMQAVPAGARFIQQAGQVLGPQRISLAIFPPILTLP